VIGNVNDKIVEYRFRYDDVCSLEYQCKLSLKLDKFMKGPVFIYYELNNFYQNHRKFLNSMSTKQMTGNNISLKEAELYCHPVVYINDVLGALNTSSFERMWKYAREIGYGTK